MIIYAVLNLEEYIKTSHVFLICFTVKSPGQHTLIIHLFLITFARAGTGGEKIRPDRVHGQ